MTSQLIKPLDAKGFWQSIGQRAIGSTVVTAQSSSGPAGLLALSATHLCADPPTMMVSINERTSALSAVLEARHFAINYLPRTARALADSFGGKGELKGAERFGTGKWTTLVTGAPVLENAVGAVDCELVETIVRHGTVVAFGRVVAAQYDPEALPLIHFRGGYLA